MSILAQQRFDNLSKFADYLDERRAFHDDFDGAILANVMVFNEGYPLMLAMDVTPAGAMGLLTFALDCGKILEVSEARNEGHYTITLDTIQA